MANIGPASRDSAELRSVAINASSSGDNTIVAGVLGKRIVVLLYTLVCSDAVTVTWEASGGSVLSGPCAFAANGGISVPQAEFGHMATPVGEALVLDLSGAVQVGGHALVAVV